jgi:tRNA(fMet)-specific endonuclease VapC
MYFLDTGILIGFVKSAEYFQYVQQEYFNKNPSRELITSRVNIAEILAFALKNSWQIGKLAQAASFISQYTRVLNIDGDDILEQYVYVDAFAEKNKHPTEKRPKSVPAQRMGKNDIWIAATVIVTEQKLQEKIEILSTDNDFRTISPYLVKATYIDPRTDAKGNIAIHQTSQDQKEKDGQNDR